MWFRQVPINVTASLISANKKQSKDIINIALQELHLWVGFINNIGIREWNGLPEESRKTNTLSTFKSLIKNAGLNTNHR